MRSVIRESLSTLQVNYGQNSSEFFVDKQRVGVHCRFLEQGRTVSELTREYLHPHPCFFRLFLFEQGSGALTARGQTWRMRKPALYGLPDNMAFDVTYAPCNLVYFHLQIVDHTELPLFAGLEHVLALRDAELFADVLKAFAGGNQPRLQALVLQAVVEMARPLWPSLAKRMLLAQRFGPVIEAIRDRPPALLNVDELAQQSHFTRAALSKGFKRSMGVSLKAYLTHIYEQRAKELLQFSDATVEEISERLGHTSSTYFYRKFKKITGMTPTAFREAQNASQDPQRRRR